MTALTWSDLSVGFSSLPLILGMALNCPVAFYLFFKLMPPKRSGFLLGLIMSSKEFLWVIPGPTLLAAFYVQWQPD
jgi:hypothetical protein